MNATLQKDYDGKITNLEAENINLKSEVARLKDQLAKQNTYSGLFGDLKSIAVANIQLSQKF